MGIYNIMIQATQIDLKVGDQEHLFFVTWYGYIIHLLNSFFGNSFVFISSVLALEETFHINYCQNESNCKSLNQGQDIRW